MKNKADACEKIAVLMGLKNIGRAKPEYGTQERVTYEVNDLRRCIFNPYADHEDFAEVVLFFMTQHQHAPWVAIPPSREAFLEFVAYGGQT